MIKYLATIFTGAALGLGVGASTVSTGNDLSVYKDQVAATRPDLHGNAATQAAVNLRTAENLGHTATFIGFGAAAGAAAAGAMGLASLRRQPQPG